MLLGVEQNNGSKRAWYKKRKIPVTVEATGIDVGAPLKGLASCREGGLDLCCGRGRVAALECRRHSIHYRSRSSPICQNTEAPCRVPLCFGARGGT